MAVAFTINGGTVELAAGETLFEAATRLGVAVPSSCQKQGRCRECLVEIVAGAELLTARAREEDHLKGGFRLACRARALDGASGTVKAHTLRRAAMRIEDGAVNLPPAAGSVALDPAVTRAGDRIFLDGREVDHRSGPIHGLAMDLGTTTIVVRCVELETGATVATTAFENPQRFGGSDVMARIQFDTERPGRLLQRTLLGYLGRAIRSLPVAPESIYELVVVGNPTMRDLFFGLEVHSIGQKPYRSRTETAFRAGQIPTTALTVPAAAFRLPLNLRARVYGLPLVGGHVGADAAACLLALEPHRSEALVAIMDIGTNTELILGNRHRLLAASCPAGPAFEGRAIRCGMPGLDGAIARVSLENDGRVRTDVIGGGPAEGICGSGLIDLLSELVRTGRMNAFGRFEDGATSFPVDAAREILFHESDANELAQAKGANVAGLQIVARRYGSPLAALERFYLAGGFGRHLDVAAARRIGLVPNLDVSRIVQVGNASIEGAAIALRSVTRRRELEELVTRIEHVELETDPDFFDHFVSGCQFIPVEPEAVA
ncbi:MAG TPA: ASKHA domain-containing protein [Opitutaceae bacterium]|nr:ASKHA domain-containing protein [Opitutaceae bacterium]